MSAPGLFTEPNSPAWLSRFAQRADQTYKAQSPGAPERIYHCTSAQAPDPTKYLGALIAFDDVPCLAYSNGVKWLRTLALT